MKTLITISRICVVAVALATASQAFADRVKDIASAAAVRSNHLIGYGLVVGLQGTGDGADVSFTAQSMKGLLNKLGRARAGWCETIRMFRALILPVKWSAVPTSVTRRAILWC